MSKVVVKVIDGKKVKGQMIYPLDISSFKAFDKSIKASARGKGGVWQPLTEADMAWRKLTPKQKREALAD